MLKIENMLFGYTKERLAVNDISFTINDGEMVAICGRNGSGKTTLTRLIMGIEQQQSGKIYYQGKDISDVEVSKRGQYIGYVFQRPDRQMFKATVEEEIAFGPEQLGYSPEEVKEITKNVMEKVGITEYAQEYPLNLRRGLKQRIAIASALAMRSEIIILDEPTSGQDGRETVELLTILKELNDEGKVIILVTHDMDIVSEYCSRVVVMRDGKLAFDNTPQELFTNCEEIYDLGLDKPVSVQLSENIPELGYCPTMAVFEERMLSLKEGN